MRAVLSLFLTALLCATNCAYAQTDELRYQIDEKATAQAPWKVGDIIVRDAHYVTGTKWSDWHYRKFLGITGKGYIVVQDFYQGSDKKTIDPIEITQQDLVTDMPCTTSYISDVFNGMWTLWYENGQKAREVLFLDGKKQGIMTSWYESGEKQGEVPFQDGERNGLITLWHKNGEKARELSFQNGKKHGPWIEWHENGQKKYEANYKNGEMEGSATEWYENGQKKIEGQLLNGKKHGLLTEWDKKGKKISETVYEAGKEVSKKTFD